MKKALIVLLMLVVLAGSAFAKSNLMVGATTGVDFYFASRGYDGLQPSKISEVGLPLFASASYFFDKNLGVYADIGANIGLSTKVDDLKTDSINYFTVGLGASYKTQINRDLEVIASVGAEIYTSTESGTAGGVTAKVSTTDFQVILKGQAMLSVADNIKVLPGLKTSFSFIEKIKGSAPVIGTVDLSPDKFFGVAIAPIVSVCVEL